MIYKVISKPEFCAFVDALIRANTSYEPRQVDTGGNGEPIYQFMPVSSASEIAFDYTIDRYIVTGKRPSGVQQLGGDHA